ncbi:MAG: hypothetical protein SGJ27_00995 [Candidatus Melainabacteria bacterium]|nr:hypothetical protein [Candidatus Melainabacteria bacterium]
MNDVTIAEKDFGMLWSILCIVITIAIGCGVVVYIEGHSAIDYKLETGLQEFEQKFSAAAIGIEKAQPVASVKAEIPSNYTIVLQ